MAACLSGNLAYFAPEINHVSVERETRCLGCQRPSYFRHALGRQMQQKQVAELKQLQNLLSHL